MTGGRIRLEPCAGCGVAFPVDQAVCPECSTPRAGGAAGAGPQGLEDLFQAFGPMFGRAPTSRRALWGPLARSFLGRNRGCLLTVLAVFFGIPLLVGVLLDAVPAVLAVMLLVVGVLGLALTGWLVWLVRPPRSR